MRRIKRLLQRKIFFSSINENRTLATDFANEEILNMEKHVCTFEVLPVISRYETSP